MNFFFFGKDFIPSVEKFFTIFLFFLFFSFFFPFILDRAKIWKGRKSDLNETGLYQLFESLGRNSIFPNRRQKTAASPTMAKAKRESIGVDKGVSMEIRIVTRKEFPHLPSVNCSAFRPNGRIVTRNEVKKYKKKKDLERDYQISFPFNKFPSSALVAFVQPFLRSENPRERSKRFQPLCLPDNQPPKKIDHHPRLRSALKFSPSHGFFPSPPSDHFGGSIFLLSLSSDDSSLILVQRG